MISVTACEIYLCFISSILVTKAGYDFSTFKFQNRMLKLYHAYDILIDTKHQTITTGNATSNTYLQLSSHHSQHFKLRQQRQKKKNNTDCLEEAGRKGRAVITGYAVLLKACHSDFASFEEQLLEGRKGTEK